MSPASQGALEVERYIGSCLITSNARAGAHKSAKKQENGARGKPRYLQNYNNEQCPVQYAPPGTWAGAPLISMTSSLRRTNQRSSPSPGAQQQQQQPIKENEQLSSHLHNRSPLTRLAIQTQGAPLILAGRFHNRGKINNGAMSNGNVAIGNSNNTTSNNSANVTSASNANAGRCPPARGQRGSGEPAKKLTTKESTAGKDNGGSNVANIDSLSIASDESSGSNNSENSLPRIIKPRKRRKKDRKPPNVAGPADTAKPDELGTAISEQSSIVTLKPYVPVCYERYEAHRGHRRPPVPRESYGRPQSTHEIVDTRQRYHHRHMVKVLDGNRNVVVPPVRVNHTKNYRNGTGIPFIHDYGETATGCEEGLAEGGPGSCQCRYCDPSGLIWDVDQNGYSPFLTPPLQAPQCNDYSNVHYSHVPLFLSRPLCQETTPVELFDEAPRLHMERENGTILRRSWSDPTSYFSEEILPNRSVGVIGDRGLTEASKGKVTSWRGSTSSTGSSASSSTPGVPSQGLEVSTEIVTSPNGHRDLEIKFYSSSPTATIPEDKAIFPDEDFSDIWSYHESKLQQDFRTLLQAEE
ncbi:uncharacterized protein LOC112494850 [Cephus cinctus]|uniref:Uncharacterized protein LOC112494850 n=1 Tax=Cephus cinctus TaxID=211228 RepID=A0AAJ7RP77_CEPCN|nr:uncharacterized protein LOC112494850 [Cephus cinctus]